MQHLTVPQYAKHKGISHQAVYAQIKRGTLPFVRTTISKKELRIPVEDIEMKNGKGK